MTPAGNDSDSSTEAEILARYSTPGLRRGALTRAAKKDQLNGMKVPPADRDKILGELYPPERAE